MLYVIISLMFGVFWGMMLPGCYAWYRENDFPWAGVELPRTGLVLSGLFSMGLSLVFAGNHPVLILAWGGVFSSLLASAYMDASFEIIPDRFQVSGALSVGIILWLEGISPQSWVFLPLGLFLMGVLYEGWSGKAGMGMGDLKLLLWVSALLGEMVLWTLLVASLLGLAQYRLEYRGEQTAPFAFAPALASVTIFNAILVFMEGGHGF